MLRASIGVQAEMVKLDAKPLEIGNHLLPVIKMASVCSLSRYNQSSLERNLADVIKI